MSSNRVIVDSNGRQFSADSFDRFGDDMTELVLSYLNTEDKFGLEYVSKRWQRLIHNKTFKLEISLGEQFNKYLMALMALRLGKPIPRTEAFVMKVNVEDDMNRLKALLKKCPNVGVIDFEGKKLDITVIEVIAELCPHLNAFEFSSEIENDFKALTHFGKTLGPKMKTLRGISRIELFFGTSIVKQEMLSYCLNIEKLVGIEFSLIAGEKTQHLPKLKSLETTCDPRNVRLLDNFCVKYGKQLKYFEFELESVADFEPKEVIQVFESLHKLEDIVDLNVKIGEFAHKVPNITEDIRINIDKELKQIGRNCRKLKRIQIYLCNRVLINGKIFHSFAEFKSLKSLSLRLELKDRDQLVGDMGLNTAIEYLSLNCNQLTEQMFANIAQSVPYLKSFELKTSSHLSDTILQSLSGLSSLRELVLSGNKRDLCITDNGFIQLLDNCQTLKKIIFAEKTAISIKSIERLIAFAMSTKTGVTIELPKDYLNEDTDSPLIDSNVLSFLPSNLNICYEEFINSEESDESDDSSEESEGSDESIDVDSDIDY